MARYYSDEAVSDLAEGLLDVQTKFRQLQGHFVQRQYQNADAKEYAVHGFARRLSTLVRATELAFELLPPEQAEIPDRIATKDCSIAIHAFLINAIGCLDNLAWVWVHEKNILNAKGQILRKSEVGFGKKQLYLRSTLSLNFQNYLTDLDEWMSYIFGFRDSLAHRVPLYIPPYMVIEEHVDDYNRIEAAKYEAMKAADDLNFERLDVQQGQYRFFRPFFTRSFKEEPKQVPFHIQMLQDYLTINEFGSKILDELEA